MRAIDRLLRNRPKAGGLSLAGKIKALFANGEQGWWYDPSNFSTLYQDSAGTTPVTAMEQPVGLQLDLSKGGVGSNGAARYNLLTKTEQFDNAAWTNIGATITANTTIAPDGTTTADTIASAAGLSQYVSQQVAATAGQQLTYTFYILKTTGITNGLYGGFSVEFRTAVAALAEYGATINSDAGSLIAASGWGTAGFASSSVVDAGNYWRITGVTPPAPASTTVVRVYHGVAGYFLNGTRSGTGSSSKVLWGADLRLASQAALTPTYQPIDTTWTASIPGNHRFQSTSANRPVVSARVNLLTKTEDFSNAAWTTNTVVGVGSTVSKTPNFGLAPDGTTTACRVLATAPLSGGLAILRQSPSTPANVTFQTACYIKSNTGVNQVIWFGRGAGSINALTVTPEWQLYTPTPELDIQTLTFFDVGAANSIGATAVDVLIWHPDIRPANQGVGLPAYQRVNTSTDYDSTGFPVYIKPNGSNQFMVTNSINFTATDKMTVWQGVRKLSATDISFVAELSANSDTNNGSFGFAAPVNTSSYYFALRGTALSCRQPTTAISAPVTSVISANYKLSEIAANEMTVQVNSNAIALITASGQVGPAGTGNFGNYPAYFYARAGTSFFFNGNDYGSIARGAASTAAQITAGEMYINSKTRAFA